MNILTRTLALAALGLGSGAALAATGDAPVEVRAHWQSQKLELNYFGLTSRYSCDGIESKVEMFLRAYGARKDLHVRASGCDLVPERVSRTARVTGEFQVLVAADQAATDTVAASWQPLELRARHPFEMDEGDCELFEQLRPMLEKSFSQREAQYSTRCVPYQVGLGSWSIKASVLRAVQP